jgi:hypothetical protein
MVEPDRLNRKTPSGFGSSVTQSRSSCLRRIVAAVKSPRKLLSMSSDFVALLAGIVGVIFTGVGVVALYVSATNAQKQIAKETTRAETLAKETEELKAKNLAVEAAISPRILEQSVTAKKLEPFSDIHFRVVSPPDFEARRTAGQIRFMLSRKSSLVLLPVHWHSLMVFPFTTGLVLFMASLMLLHGKAV